MFLDKNKQPSAAALSKALGPAQRWWDEIAAHVVRQSPRATPEWKFSGAQFGWSFRLKDKKRNLIYLLPGERSFRASFALGERAVAAVEASSIPEKVKAELRAARKYAEGRPLRLTVSTARDAAVVQAVAEIKILT